MEFRTVITCGFAGKSSSKSFDWSNCILYSNDCFGISEGLIKVLDCEKNICIEQNNYVLIFPLITFIGAFLLIIMHYSKEKEHENAFLDKWISRENEDDMRIRLTKEQEEASGDSMGSGWSEMEKKHLEKNLDEEEVAERKLDSLIIVVDLGDNHERSTRGTNLHQRT